MEPKGEPNESLVEVFNSKQESEAMVVHGLLQSAGIESMIFAREAPQDILPGVGGTSVSVRQEDSKAALNLIADFRAHPAADSEEEPEHP